jgi:enoyl-CoA hydratase
MTSVIKTSLDENGILRIIISRPDKLNALNQEVLDLLLEQFTKAKTDSAIRALLIIGEGKAFCAGADINRLAQVNAQSGYEFAIHGQEVFRALETVGKPSIAAINGFAFGGGCELAMSASLRIASPKALFGQPEVKLGVIPGYGGTQRLARLVGKGRALDLCLTGRFISANEALQWGLVTEVVDAVENLDELYASLLARAEAILKTILGMGPLAIKSVLEVIDKGYDLPLPDALHLEAVHFALTCATQDKKEGVNAFLEKKTPNFKGE